MKPALITGATGFLGRHLVELLRGRGESVRLLARSATEWDAQPGVETVRGDICSAEDVDRAVAGCGRVYHLAGFVSRHPRDTAKLYETHIEGTRHVCESALRHEVERVVAVSSSGTLAVSREPVEHNEESGYKHEIIGRWPYYLSKLFAEKLALSYAAARRLNVVVVNPALLLGPGDVRMSSTADVALFLKGQILAMPTGGMSFVDARDCAAGVEAAMQRGRAGERYILGGPNWSFREIVHALSKITGMGAPKLSTPLPVSLASAKLLRRVLPLAGRAFEMDDETIRMSVLYWYCDSAKACRDLGFHFREAMETLQDTVQDVKQRLKS